MERFEYANPTTVKDATALLGANWNDAQILAGGTDLIRHDEGFRRLAQTRGQHQGHFGTARHLKDRDGVRIGAAVTLDDLSSHALIRAEFLRCSRRSGRREPADPQHGTVAEICASARVAGISAEAMDCSPWKTAESGAKWREQISRDNSGPLRLFRQRIQSWTRAGRARRAREDRIAHRRAHRRGR